MSRIGKGARQQHEYIHTYIVDWRRIIIHRVLTIQTTLFAISCLDYHPIISIWSSYPKAERTDLVARTPSTCPFWLVITAIILLINESSLEATRHPTRPSHTLSGKIIGGSYGIRHQSTSCRIELMLTISIFVLVNVAAMYFVQSTYKLQPSSKPRGVQPSWQSLLLCTYE